MTDQPVSGASDPAPDVGPTPARAPRRRRVLIATLFVLATVFGIAAVHAVWANRQALNTDNWTSTSSQLLANSDIRNAVSAYAVTALFNSGVPEARIKAALPTKLQPLSGPLTAGLQQVAGQVAPKILASSAMQTAWREANRRAHATLVKIVDGGGSLASTNGGVVTLNLHAMVAQLATTLGVQQQVAAAQSKLKGSAGAIRAGASKVGITLPPSSGQLVIMRSSQLKTVQNIGGAIKGLALVLPLLALAFFALGVWLSKGRRRVALRRVGWCFVAIGVVVLLDRRLAGDAVVNGLVKNSANKPAAHEAWAIATTLLYDIGAAMIVYGLIFVIAAWLAGETRPATALRRALAPTLRTRPATVYIAVYAVFLLVVFWGPTPATRQLPYIVLFVVLLALGVDGLRRQTMREFPDAQAGDTVRSIRARYATRGRLHEHDVTIGAGHNGGHIAELERLARLHAGGSLTDAEFAAEKAVLME
jgi:hypothetical protein